MPANVLQKLLLETFTCDREIEHFTQLLNLRAKVRVRQVREHVDAEIRVEVNALVIEVYVEVALDRGYFPAQDGKQRWMCDFSGALADDNPTMSEGSLELLSSFRR